MNRKEKQSDLPRPDVSYVGATKAPSLVHSMAQSVTSTPIPCQASAQSGANSIQVSYGPASIVNSHGPPSLASSQSSTPIPKHHKAKSFGVQDASVGYANHGAFGPLGDPATTHQLEKVRSELHRMQMNVPLLDNDWEAHEEIRQRELAEARNRAAQMEKTMRWWSDCTANWREKWSKARNERNKAREENRQLRTKLETMAKDLTTLHRENNDLKVRNDSLKTSVSAQSLCKESKATPDVVEATNEPLQQACATSSESLPRTKSAEEMESGCYNVRRARQSMCDADSLSSDNCTTPEHGDNLELNALQLRLDEAHKTIQIEREERAKLADCMEKMEYEIHNLRFKYEDLKGSKQALADEVNRLRDLHDDEMGRMSKELEDGSSTLSSRDLTLAELREQVEKLQAENAAEWGKRERLDTEKLALERENKKLRLQMDEMQEAVSRKKTAAVMESDMKALENEVHERNRGWSDLKHAHSKLKKQHAEKLTELDHSKRRAEQFDLEVKKLRGRVDELKRDLARSEDEVDKQSNNARRLQRNNEELVEQVEQLHTQLQHTQSRLKRAGSQPNLLSSLTRAGLKTYDMMDDSTELSTDTDED